MWHTDSCSQWPQFLSQLLSIILLLLQTAHEICSQLHQVTHLNSNGFLHSCRRNRLINFCCRQQLPTKALVPPILVAKIISLQCPSLFPIIWAYFSKKDSFLSSMILVTHCISSTLGLMPRCPAMRSREYRPQLWEAMPQTMSGGSKDSQTVVVFSPSKSPWLSFLER